MVFLEFSKLIPPEVRGGQNAYHPLRSFLTQTSNFIYQLCIKDDTPRNRNVSAHHLDLHLDFLITASGVRENSKANASRENQVQSTPLSYDIRLVHCYLPSTGSAVHFPQTSFFETVLRLIDRLSSESSVR